MAADRPVEQASAMRSGSLDPVAVSATEEARGGW
ncbi:uncharacterized protein M6B38_365425 [Iris pallida]|uniref:Uncharacterized protein n=1 Tax=Iris pallida TaxID=29817 RepID=A0AAX6GGM6_IRIPA|nr:uncharacterized protein M6B38_365425 [Iris pallida]